MSCEYANDWFRVLKIGKFHFIEEKTSNCGVVILVKTHDQIMLVESFRVAQQRSMLELPRGSRNPNESDAECAIRELREETGISCEIGQAKTIGVVCPNSAILSGCVSVVLLELNEIPQKPLATDGEIERLVLLDERVLIKLIASGGITDGFTLSAWTLFNAVQRVTR